jgi:hypothetical protein
MDWIVNIFQFWVKVLVKKNKIWIQVAIFEQNEAQKPGLLPGVSIHQTSCW